MMQKIIILMLAAILAACNESSPTYQVKEDLIGTVTIKNGLPGKIDSIPVYDNIRAEYQEDTKLWNVIIRINGENICVRFSMSNSRFKKMVKTMESAKKLKSDWRIIRITKTTIFRKGDESFKEIDSAYELRDL